MNSDRDINVKLGEVTTALSELVSSLKSGTGASSSSSSDMHNVNTRFATRSTFYVPKIRTNYGKFNIRYNGPILWNETDERFKILTPYSFKRELSMHFINLY